MVVEGQRHVCFSMHSAGFGVARMGGHDEMQKRLI